MIQSRNPGPAVWERLCDAPVEEAGAILRDLAYQMPVEPFGVPIEELADVMASFVQIVDERLSKGGIMGTRLNQRLRSLSAPQIVFELQAHPFTDEQSTLIGLPDLIARLESAVSKHAKIIKILRATPAWQRQT